MHGVHDEDKHDGYRARHYWSARLRSQQMNRDPYGFCSLWPRSRMTGGDPSADLMLGVDMSEGGRYEPPNFIEGGAQRMWFIHGVCVDENSIGLGGAVVEGFLSVANTYVGSITTDSNGIYSLPTINIGVNHTLVANYGPNNKLGSSVDTLQPTLSPW